MYRYLTLIWIILIGLIGPVGAYNPFELRFRLSDEERQRIIFQERNPFELIRGEEAAIIEGFFPAVATPGGRVNVVEDQRYIESPGVLFWVYLGLFGFMALLINLAFPFFLRIFRASINDQLTQSMMARQEANQSLWIRLWSFFFMANTGIFVFQVANYFTKGLFPGTDFYFMIWFGLGVALYYILKRVILTLMGWVFPVSKVTDKYIFLLSLFNILLGFGLFPINLGMSYAGEAGQGVFVYIGLIWVGLNYLLRLIRTTWLGLPYMVGYPIHFFLYLCTLEWIPLLILARWLMSQKGGGLG